MTAPIDPVLLERPFRITGPDDFNALALDLFHLHEAHNPVYRGFLNGLGRRSSEVVRWEDIPCLPISFFKRTSVLLEGHKPRVTFTSSGTTGAETSRHHLPWPGLYMYSFMEGFRLVYGDVRNWRIIALLPSYLERSGSSLVNMAEELILASGDPLSGTYLHQYEAVRDVLRLSEAEGKPTMLLGVTFALLDLAEQFPQLLRHTVVVETGGMKGRRTEIVREELHATLKQAFGVSTVHSEYGMTELLSQAWSTGGGTYRCPPWMQVRLRDVNDPFGSVPTGRTGGLNVFDLCNIASCPFIATQDLGRVQADGTFEVLGRFDNSDVRGCSLMVDG